MPKRPKTNIEFITELMEFSQSGALMQAFIFEALKHYADDVKDAKPWSKDALISFEAWQACAEEVLHAIETRN